MTRPNESDLERRDYIAFGLSILACFIFGGFVGWMIWFAWRSL